MANPSHDLLPCPFCKNSDLYTEMGSTPSPGDYIMCDGPDGCGATISRVDTPDDDLIGAWNRRATPPSPSTAPEVSELPAPPTLPRYLLDMIGEYGMARTDSVGQLEVQYRWETLIGGIKRYASEYGRALASRPADTSLHAVHDKEPTKSLQRAEVDDEGLPPLPPEAARAMKGAGTFFVKWQDAGKDLRGALMLYTAEQFRQGQRDAVAADRARREQRQSGAPSSRAEVSSADVFELYSAADALHKAGAVVAGVNVRFIADKLVDVGSGAGWK